MLCMSLHLILHKKKKPFVLLCFQSSGEDGDWEAVRRLCAQGTSLLHQSRGFFDLINKTPPNPTPTGVPAHLPLPRPLPLAGLLMLCSAIATFKLGFTLKTLTETQQAVAIIRGGWVRALAGRSRHNTSLTHLQDLETKVPVQVDDQAVPFSLVCLWSLPVVCVHGKVFVHLPTRARDTLSSGAVSIVATADYKAQLQQTFTDRWHAVSLLARPLPEWVREIESSANQLRPPPKPPVATTINTLNNRKRKKVHAVGVNGIEKWNGLAFTSEQSHTHTHTHTHTQYTHARISCIGNFILSLY